MGWLSVLPVSNEEMVKTVKRRSYGESLAELKVMARDLSMVKVNPGTPSEIDHYRWTTFSDGNIGTTILNILASHMYTVDYYTGRYLNELYYPPNEITTVQQLNELLNFKQMSTSALRATVRLDLYKCGPTSPARISRFHRINLEASGDNYEFMVTDNYVLMPNVTTLDITIARGERFSVSERADAVNNSRIFLGETPVDFESISFTVDGIEWTQVDNIFYHGSGFHNYSVHQEEDGFFIYLSDNWISTIPSELSRIEIMGLRILSNPVQGPSCFKFSFIDPVVTDSGVDITDLMRLLPRNLVVPESSRIIDDHLINRAVTLDDYYDHVLNFPGVSLAAVFDYSIISSGIVDPFVLEVIAVSSEGLLDDFVKSGILAYLKRIGLNYITDITISDPDIALVNVTVTVGVSLENGDDAIQSVIMDRVNRSITNLFKIGNVPVGQDLEVDGYGEELISIAVDRSDDRIESVNSVIFDIHSSIDYNTVNILNNVTVLVEINEEED